MSFLGIEMHNAIVRNAKAKPIERTFYTFKEHFSKAIETFCDLLPDMQNGLPAVIPHLFARDTDKHTVAPDFLRCG